MFRASRPGLFRLTIHTPLPREVIISHDIGATILSVLAWLLATVACFVLLLAGSLVLLRGTRQPTNR